MEENTENTIKEEYSPKPRSFYSFNLTEERIIFIFVSLIIFVALVLFSILIIFSKKTTDVNFQPAAENHSQVENEDIYITEETEIGSYEEGQELTEEQIAAENMSSESASQGEPVESENGMQTGSNGNFETGEEAEEDEEVIFASEFIKKMQEKAREEQNFVPVTNEKTKTTASQQEQAVNTKPADSPAATTQTAKKESKKKMYVIQIASYTDKANAEKISSFYKESGYPVYVKSKVKDSKTYYRLRIGPFTDQKEANEFLSKLKSSKYGKDSYISVGYF